MRTETTVTTNEDALISMLKKQCGKLWIVLELSGISVFQEKHRTGFLCFVFTIKKLCYPVFLHCNLLYLLYVTAHNTEKIDYAFIIDMTKLLLINIMWWIIYTRRYAFRTFLVHVAHTMPINLISQTRYMAYVINVSLFVILVYPFLIANSRFSENTDFAKKLEEIFRPVHEIIFPSIVNVIYTMMCYLLFQNLRIIKIKFQKDLNLSSVNTVTKLKQNYLDVVKGIEMLENLFSVPAFILVVKNTAVISIVVMDMMHRENWMSELLLEAVLYLTFIFGSMGVLTVYAGNIPLEMSRIKAILLDKLSQQCNGDCLSCGEKQINYIIKRDVNVLTACNVFEFDRGFLLKVLITVVAQAVVIYQLGRFLNVVLNEPKAYLYRFSNHLTHNYVRKCLSFANVTSGEIRTSSQNVTLTNSEPSENFCGFLAKDNNVCDLTQVLKLFSVISDLSKRKPKLLLNLLSKIKSAHTIYVFLPLATIAATLTTLNITIRILSTNTLT
ncbi:uncharacterized protein TNCT_264651 [Trichonephila clavata]|uniref:Uncharacterized protein n=1 Tax=Trichonephila clavata TaxID=2740835 RepID=A0A8X6FV53_TRICU|nr:uncharacterized protein TNCT_264651 [Trichonephila clavata]